ncbi:glycoside hydrolase family 2 TIM barrel-domain containing protein [Paenibacillus oryzisoli]|uniref:glycoside hydrolase family 2 protein n=1 Tax=Paenibacillus oryzisoli TaxID=1850517 RepID=UPI003D26B414
MRKQINMNANWTFTKQGQPAAHEIPFDPRGWESVNLPHTWNAIDGANGFDFYKGACWYRKTFAVDTAAQGQRVYIEFEGVNSIADVYVNGQHLGQHRGGYSTFRFDMTEALQIGGDNVLSVKVDNTVVDDVYPQMADFTFFGGIYRNVNMIVVSPVHIDLMDYGSSGVYIVQEQVTNERAALTVKTQLVNTDDTPKKVRLWTTITAADGQAVAYAASEAVLPAGTTQTIAQPVTLAQPLLWNGLKQPHLYTANVAIISYNDTIDELSIPFGVRYFSVDPEQGFFLNGKHLPLHGVSRHQDRKDMGWAITCKEHDEDMALIREVGATSIRLAHYQHDAYFYDLCDREGMVVWAEIPFISVMSKHELEGLNAKQQMIELIRQNYNHPSIVFWGIQNEIQIGGDSPALRKLVSELNELTKQEDPTRLSTMANVMFVEDTDPYNYVTDVIGYNKYYGWYNGKAEDFAAWIDGFHRVNPGVKLSISEYGAEGIIEYHNTDPKVKDYSEEYHALYHETVWNIFAARPFLWGTYVWNMFDFGANIRDEGGVKGRNNKGLVTYDRKIKKDAFYLYKAHWSAEKFAHIASKRYIDRPDERIAVKVYSNCEYVTLYVNGAKAAVMTGGQRVFVFPDVALTSGLNEIKVEAVANGLAYKDTAWFQLVAEANPSYEAPEEKGGFVQNWFQVPELTHITVEELVITDDVFSTRCSMGEMMEHAEARAILEKYLGNFAEHPMFGMTKGMKIDMLASMAADLFTETLMYAMNKELTAIRKPAASPAS